MLFLKRGRRKSRIDKFSDKIVQTPKGLPKNIIPSREYMTLVLLFLSFYGF